MNDRIGSEDMYVSVSVKVKNCGFYLLGIPGLPICWIKVSETVKTEMATLGSVSIVKAVVDVDP
ncbi:hypothetical protein Lal_00040119 [Lupinus albus]|nr:hypothetical protein Lal_00040119 [Lupinus albus]